MDESTKYNLLYFALLKISILWSNESLGTTRYGLAVVLPCGTRIVFAEFWASFGIQSNCFLEAQPQKHEAMSCILVLLEMPLIGSKKSFLTSPPKEDPLDADADELLLLAKKIPEEIKSRVLERPDAFRRIAKLDDGELDDLLREMERKKEEEDEK